MQPPIVDVTPRTSPSAKPVVDHLAEDGRAQCDYPAAAAAPTRIGQWRNNIVAKQGRDPTRCAHPARFTVGPHRLCARHAGQLLLDAALALRLADGRQDGACDRRDVSHPGVVA